MGRFSIFTGILLIIVAIAFMLATLGALGDDIMAEIILPIACETGDTLRTQTQISYTMDETSQSIEYFCVDNEGIEVDVTGSVIMIIIVGFSGLLGTAILMIFIGAAVLARRVSRNFTNTLLEQQNIGNMQSSTFDLRGDRINQAQLSPEAKSVMNQVFSQVGDVFANNDSLADRLRQLEEAKREGLISQSEYDRTRQAILDSMDD